MDVVDRMREIIDAQTYGPPDDDGEIVGPFRKTWVLALLGVVEGAYTALEYGDAEDLEAAVNHLASLPVRARRGAGTA